MVVYCAGVYSTHITNYASTSSDIYVALVKAWSVVASANKHLTYILKQSKKATISKISTQKAGE